MYTANVIHIAILGTGNIGTAIADGLVQSGQFAAPSITLTRRRAHLLEPMRARGFRIEGAAALLLATGNHPEHEIDRVTTPRGCTIAGLNRMEHEGFSSALIKGITVSAAKAAGLYEGEE